VRTSAGVRVASPRERRAVLTMPWSTRAAAGCQVPQEFFPGT
jgi:hypothetical protein